MKGHQPLDQLQTPDPKPPDQLLTTGLKPQDQPLISDQVDNLLDSMQTTDLQESDLHPIIIDPQDLDLELDQDHLDLVLVDLLGHQDLDLGHLLDPQEPELMDLDQDLDLMDLVQELLQDQLDLDLVDLDLLQGLVDLDQDHHQDHQDLDQMDLDQDLDPLVWMSQGGGSSLDQE